MDLRTEGVKLFIMAVLNLQHRYSNEAEIADIYDDYIYDDSFDFFFYRKTIQRFKGFRPEFTIFIFIHNKSRIAVAILALLWMKMT